MKGQITIGTRGSDLALWQAGYVKEKLESLFPELHFETRVIRTTGDSLSEVSLAKIGDKGLFTRQIDAELLEARIDLAVHSLKDLQTIRPDGVVMGAVCRRETANDVLIAKNVHSIDDLPEGARVATGSLRRRCQLLSRRPDLEVVDIRGNVPTRLSKFAASNLDGMILAYAGVKRLGFDGRISQVIPFDIMLPAVGQGAVAVEYNENNSEAGMLAAKLDDFQTRICVMAERAFLRRLEGGCQVPVGAISVIGGENLILQAAVGNLDGTKVIREKITGNINYTGNTDNTRNIGEAESLGVKLAEKMIELGAETLLEESRTELQSSESIVL